MSEVILTPEAQEDFLDLDQSAREVVAKGLVKLETSPEQRGAPLGASLKTFRKLVVGKKQYRIIYRVESDGTVVIVYVIGPRSDDEVYKMARDRLALRRDSPARRAAIDILDQAFTSSED
ncbi:type II toxin-antitoxin system RelE family toxin [Saccharopolyspora phatthalungensis]|uniref:mRNA interferase RelE/StbE n=1 Tax=Saccharopolyspora phatthalungensis TaxID=664693 RepID=A0A840Q4I4_9PSEU|nr:type II toxin-antitoxin system RelE/ParE family toxin [Saccharopolyspora phatthalungensis]MBB5154561.1 mRNA interferase RelE/StbE [Saccharopolyspora phatthalungensis]